MKKGRPSTLLQNRLWHRCLSVNFEKFLRTPFSQNTSGQLLLHVADEKAAVDSHQDDKTVFEKENSI